MRLERILDLVYQKPWAITPAKHQAIQALLESHLAGNALSNFGLDEDAEKAEPFVVVGSVGVINVEGVILNKCSTLETFCGAFSCEIFRRDLRALAAKEDVKNIIFNISSSGGTVTGVPETADLIAEIAKTKPVYAFSNDTIASAAYWLASQTKGIFLSKSAEIGSIGVYCALLDVTEAFKKDGLKLELFKAGTFKAMGIPGRSLTDEERKMLQDGVDKTYAQFVAYVNSKRPMVSSETMQGQMFDAPDAVINGLADGIVNEIDDLIAYLNK